MNWQDIYFEENSNIDNNFDENIKFLKRYDDPYSSGTIKRNLKYCLVITFYNYINNLGA